LSTYYAEKTATESNRGIVILGAGGHAKVVIEIFRAAGETIAFCVANAMPVGGVVLGVPVVVGEDDCATGGHDDGSEDLTRMHDDVVQTAQGHEVVAKDAASGVQD
jgi:hypothetical protein